jgi:hypothetical protein
MLIRTVEQRPQRNINREEWDDSGVIHRQHIDFQMKIMALHRYLDHSSRNHHYYLFLYRWIGFVLLLKKINQT